MEKSTHGVLLGKSEGKQCHVSKGKTIPVQARTGPEGFRNLKRPYFKTIGT
jgi:hypothetical protein